MKHYLGAHMSASAGWAKMGQAAADIGATTMAFFCRNPRGSRAKAVKPADMAALRALLAEKQFGPLVAHAPYIMNPCSKDESIRSLAERMLTEDLALMEYLPGNYYNFHPGSHVGQGAETGIAQITAMLNRVLRPELATTVLLETMAGKGSEVGGRFEELAAIIQAVEAKDRIGVCLDTCHISDAGYPVKDGLNGVLEEFDRVVGLPYLKALHINDSLNPLGSKKDRHAKIGQGTLGIDTFVQVITHPALEGLPFILETPDDDKGHGEEIALLRSLCDQ